MVKFWYFLNDFVLFQSSMVTMMPRDWIIISVCLVHTHSTHLKRLELSEKFFSHFLHENNLRSRWTDSMCLTTPLRFANFFPSISHTNLRILKWTSFRWVGRDEKFFLQISHQVSLSLFKLLWFLRLCTFSFVLLSKAKLQTAQINVMFRDFSWDFWCCFRSAFVL